MNILIGQYFSGKSPVHRLDPRIKIILTIVYLMLVFTVDKAVSYIILTVYTITLVIICGIPIRLMLRSIRPMLWIFFFTAVVNLFTVPGNTFFSIPFFKLTVTYEGIAAAVSISIRLLLLVEGASLLTLTTKPLALTDGIERLLSPLRKIRVPTQEIAMMMTIAIRFIPTLAEEADKIRKAQLARGASFESGNIINRAKAAIPLIIPLLIGVFRRADALAMAMDARCYNGDKRTKMHEMKITELDIEASAVFAVCAAILLIAEFAIEF